MLSLEYCELTKYNVNPKDVVSSIFISDIKFMNVLLHASNSLIRNKHIFEYVSLFLNCCIYENSDYKKEYIADTCSIRSFVNKCLNIPVNLPAVVEENYAETFNQTLNIDKSYFTNVSSILYNLYLTEMRFNKLYSDSVVLVSGFSRGLVISSIGTILNMRYRELIGKEIIHNVNFDLNGGEFNLW